MDGNLLVGMIGVNEVITVLVGGAMGTACALVLAQNSHHPVRLCVRNSAYADEIRGTRENRRLLPGVQLPDVIEVTADVRACLHDSSVAVVCVPTRGLREACRSWAPALNHDALLVSTVKGIENGSLNRPSQILRQELGHRPVVILGGPCHAEELARRLPASIVAASEAAADAERVQNLFSNDHLRVYANPDLAGVELAAALKNVIAIAAGISDGLQYGDNARAALITRGLAEMVRFGVKMGAQPETFYGLAGIGDLVVTCGSRHSRNRAFGELLGRGHKREEIEANMQAVAEGVFTARSIVEIAQQQNIDMPIAHAVYRVLFEDHSPSTATQELMQRPLKSE